MSRPRFRRHFLWDTVQPKIQTAEFYFERLLPRADGHRVGASAPTSSVMQVDKDHIAFE